MSIALELLKELKILDKEFIKSLQLLERETWESSLKVVDIMAKLTQAVMILKALIQQCSSALVLYLKEVDRRSFLHTKLTSIITKIHQSPVLEANFFTVAAVYT